MDLKKTIAELHAQREQIEQAILALEGLAAQRRGRGRPPKSLSNTKNSALAAPPRKLPTSAAER
jgi:hypothetical protein